MRANQTSVFYERLEPLAARGAVHLAQSHPEAERPSPSATAETVFVCHVPSLAGSVTYANTSAT